MENNLFEELAKYDLKDCNTVIFEDDIYAYLEGMHRKLNSELAIKEAASWEAASKLVLTD